jgi:hypothetical protein
MSRTDEMDRQGQTEGNGPDDPGTATMTNQHGGSL